MRLIEAEKVKRVMKDYWKAQVDKALTFTDGNEANKRINSYLEHNHELLKVIDELSSAEPYTTTHDSIPAETGKNDEDRTSDDCISRQAAIDALCSVCNALDRGHNCDKTKFVYDAPQDEQVILCPEHYCLCALPSVQPERKTGHWILDRSGAYCCSKCMEPCASYTMMKPRDKFCKMCGSRNEVME